MQAVEVQNMPVRLNLPDIDLEGDLTLPPKCGSIIVFAHGSGSGRFSPRNRAVAATLNGGNFATLLLDLLSTEEQEIDEATARMRFDIDLLGRRMTETVDWVRQEERTRNLRIGLFGASTGAAAALVAAAARPEAVSAVVSRGGRPDLAGDSLHQVRCPVLLVVGGNDEPVIELNRQAAKFLTATSHLIRIIPGATHLFPEPGKLEQVATLACEWFQQHLATPSAEHEA